MSLMTRAVGAFAVLSLAAIPVAALTIQNSSSKDVSIAVDNGSEESVYQIPAGGSVEVKQDCSSDCAVTGPWGFSRLVAQNATIDTDGSSLVTVELAPKPRSLVPQNPASETLEDSVPAASVAAPSKTKTAVKKTRKRTTKPVKQAKKKGPAPGSLQMLFQGPGK